jgi:hypothetical protein
MSPACRITSISGVIRPRSTNVLLLFQLPMSAIRATVYGNSAPAAGAVVKLYTGEKPASASPHE